MYLFERKELKFGKKGLVADIASSFLMSALGLNRVNELYRRTHSATGMEFETLMEELGVESVVSDKDLSNIPAEGAAVVICNHPTGAVDGLLMLGMLLKVRGDVRFMGNYLLDRVEYLKKYFIAVDPFDTRDNGKNTRGLRECMHHIGAGGLLVIFPAGEVATWQRNFCDVRDKTWGESAMKFIKRLSVPVVPVFIECSNSRLFHLAGKIHPMLRTAMLPHEMVNKKGRRIIVNIGSAIIPKRVVALTDKVYNDFLRANVEYLDGRLASKRPGRGRHARVKPMRPASEIVPAGDLSALEGELRSIEAESLLFNAGPYGVYFAAPEIIPLMMTEIGRQREITYRQIGEGSLNSIDTDRYDRYYRQLFIWDNTERRLVGAYRFGMGDEIVRDHGLEGFYTNTLFRMSPEMEPIMSRTIELGRSFIVEAYQRKTSALMLLWKGILYILLKNTQFDNLLGPVSVSGDMDVRSKVIIVEYLRRHHMNREYQQYVHPVTGLEGVEAKIDLSLIGELDSLDLVGKLVGDIERDRFTIPILVKKYLQLNSTVLGFNVDHDFSDALDAMMFLELKNVPDETIAMLSKEITEIDIAARFREIK